MFKNKTTARACLGTLSKGAALAVVLVLAMLPNSAGATIVTVCQNDFACGGPGSCTGGTVCARDIDRQVPGCCTVFEAYCATDCITPQPWFNLCPTGFCRGSFSSTSGGENDFGPLAGGPLAELVGEDPCSGQELMGEEPAMAEGGVGADRVATELVEARLDGDASTASD